ncbi:hypothetical protein [Dankookia sp. P2]|uniref:hypothetical protein n=1 Tax=Dankookia sp. P2 TaxID=3423955 RepID=UPI003D66A608
METKVGRVSLVQEGRFQLVEDDGCSTLFVLSHAAAIEPQDLPALQRDSSRIAVRCYAAPGKVAQVAHAIRVLDRAPETSR